MQCTDSYRRIREKRSGTMLECDWCKHKFEKNEWFALAHPKLGHGGPKRNWALCHTCADIIGAPNRTRDNQRIELTG